MDISKAAAPKSDQLDAIELIGGERTFTIERVTPNSEEQPYNYHLQGFPRVWRPGRSMFRVMIAAWTSESDNHVGQSLTLFRDPKVNFGGVAVGGTRIKAMTGIDKPLKIVLPVSRGKSELFTVLPLEVAAPVKQRDFLAELEMAGDDLDAVKALGNAAIAAHVTADVLTKIRARRDQLIAGGQ